jgi:uncharacterized RDD family membrane protein YckC
MNSKYLRLTMAPLSEDLLDQSFSDYYKDASRTTRAANYFLDLCLLCVLFLGFLFLVGFGVSFVDPNLPHVLTGYISLLFIAWVFIYFLGCEWLLQGRTLAKYITGTRALGLNGTALTMEQAVLRTLCRFIPFDNFSFLFMKQGFHDMLSNTRVVIWQNKVK